MLNVHTRYQFSRFAYIRQRNDCFVLESARNDKSFTISNLALLALLQPFLSPMRPTDVLEHVDEGKRSAVQKVIDAWVRAEILVPSGDDMDEKQGILAHWDFHDLLFHTSSRYGLNREAIGATFRLRDIAKLEPASTATEDFLEQMPLPHPAVSEITPNPISLFDALEKRRTCYGSGRLDLQTLSTFLFHTCRATDGSSDFVKKVYPSGGSLHSLEVYIIAASCADLEPALYKYLPSTHALSKVRDFDNLVRESLSDVSVSTAGLCSHPAILFIISSHFQRVAWKYQSIAYRLILLELGCLVQTMYLVATAMNLLPCALGCGNSERFARMISANYFSETSIGEFILSAKD